MCDARGAGELSSKDWPTATHGPWRAREIQRGHFHQGDDVEECGSRSRSGCIAAVAGRVMVVVVGAAGIKVQGMTNLACITILEENHLGKDQILMHLS